MENNTQTLNNQKNKKHGINYFKLFILTLIFFSVLYYFFWYNKGDNNIIEDDNKDNFVVKNIDMIGIVGVAVSTNVGIRNTLRKNLPDKIYRDSIKVGYVLINNEVGKEKLINSNMIFLGEYSSILKTNVRSLIISANDRQFTLDAYISELKYRGRQALNNIEVLKIHKEELLEYDKQIQEDLNEVKKILSESFKNFNPLATNANIKKYLELKEKSTKTQTYIVYINRFSRYYNELNTYNKKLLLTLGTNKELIIKDVNINLAKDTTKILESNEYVKNIDKEIRNMNIDF